MNSSKFEKYGVRVSLLALVAITILFFIRHGAYQMGLNLMQVLQVNIRSPKVIALLNFIYFLTDGRFIFVFLLAVHLLTSRKLNSIVFTAYIAMNVYLLTLEKQLLQDERPVAYDYRIEVLDWSCPSSYSFPNGHGWFSVLLYEPVISDLIGRKSVLGWLLLTGTLIPVAGLCLASHSLDQVISGAVHSLATLLLYKCCLQRTIYQLMAKALRGISLRAILLGNTLLLLLSAAFPIFLFYFNSNHRQPWSAIGLFSMKQACAKTQTQDDIERETGKTAAVIGVVFGFVYGFAVMCNSKIRSRFMVESEQRDLYIEYVRSGSLNGRNVNAFKQLLLYAILGSAFLAIKGYFQPHSFQGEYVKLTLLYCLMGFTVTFVIPNVISRFQAINDNFYNEKSFRIQQQANLPNNTWNLE